MSFRLSKPLLIEGRREWTLFFAGAAVLFFLSLGWRYVEYQRFVAHKKLFFDADVLLHYTKTKRGRTYDVLKLQSDTLTFYTTTRKPLKENLRGRRIRLVAFPSRVGFADYLTTPYLPSHLIKTVPSRSLRMRLYERIADQHESPRMRELYGALFLALPISKALREEVSRLGINHLLALSGFHMGLLWAILYGTLSLLYRPLQSRFFPWRHRLLDVGAVTLLVLGGYLLLAGMPPSLLRAYAMVVAGWLALLWGIELLSFSFLAVCVTVLAALFPGLLLSLGFWLSVAGVFFIYLFLAWTQGWPAWAVFAGLNVWVYLAMLPAVHAFFPLFTPWQLLSPLLTALFALFYPLAMALHAVGLGGVMDEGVSALLRLPGDGIGVQVGTPLWLLILYVGTALAAVRWRFARYLQGGLALFFLLFLVEQVA